MKGVGTMEKVLITIGRQFGSNGRIIGETVAKKMGIPCYDKQLIKQVAKESGLWENLLDELDEKHSNSFLYSVVMDPYSFAHNFDTQGYGMNLSQRAFMATYNTIEKIAKEGSGVFIGRCSNYVLRNMDPILNIFLYAPMEVRIRTVMDRFSLSEKQAKDQIQKEDKARASYYNYYTSSKWGRIDGYDICIDTSKLGVEKTADQIIAFAEQL
ncbi:MAG: cytidylate kinase-like family protein [Eubacterium sp.]|nr:cytidylate kinase-like family protein [Eubacterium sp.]